MIDLLSLLTEKGVLDPTDASSVSEEAKRTGKPVETVLLGRGIARQDILAAKSSHWEIPAYELSEKQIPYEILRYIPEESAVHYQVVPLGIEEGVLAVGVLDPDNIEALDALNFISAKVNLPFKVYLISQEDFEKVIQMYKGLSGEVGRALTELDAELSGGDEATNLDLSDAASVESISAPAKNTTQGITEDAPVTKIVATLLRNAVEGGASDIHVENTGTEIRVRFRVDGILHTSIVLPTKVHRAVVARVKILASMKLDERRKPQDGRFSATIGGRKVDFRVSTFPTQYGEKVVMRILDSEQNVASLDDIGVSAPDLEVIREVIKKPYGLILITGPTGSGKSTTLYSMLTELDRDKTNVISLEDPVEYHIEGISQSQVRPEIGYTFASGLRSVLRQDPDIIMVGEIRDKETAQLAVQAALTGHLVFSTLHTNNAPGAVPRLVDMGVDPYLIAPTLELVIAQRLVRKICPDSGRKIPIEGSLKRMIDEQFKDLPEQYRSRIPQADSVLGIEATDTCPSGTRGRTAVFELMRINDEMEQTILDSSDENMTFKTARKNGMLTMKEDAIIKALNGEIPFEEVNTLGGDMLAEEAKIEDQPTVAEAGPPSSVGIEP